MNQYEAMRARQQKAIDQYLSRYGFFAFSEDQFKEGIKKLGADPGQLSSIPGGGYLLTDKVQGFIEMLQANKRERSAALTDPEYAFNMFYSELANHEYSYTGDAEETLQALGMSEETVRADPVLSEAFDRAKAEALRM